MWERELEKAKRYANLLLSYKPRSEKEVRKRLQDKCYNEDVINIVIDSFKRDGIIDDRQFTRNWVQMRTQSSPRGISFIRQELISKEVDEALVNETIAQLKSSFNEEKAVEELIKRRSRRLIGLDRNKTRQRLFGYLKRRGFSSDMIYKALNETY